MERAAVLIGVKKTGGIPVLQAVNSSLAHMAKWLRGQGIPKDRLRILSDRRTPVTASAIKEAVKGFLDLGCIEQLIVYFTGHGTIVGASEFWLLSGAPDNADEAVNLDLSVTFARRSKVLHVIFISDACRTPAAGAQAQSIIGSSIFPNFRPQRSESSVDIFFGSSLGSPSLEVRSSADVGGEFRAVFTDSLVHALRGNVPSILELGEPAPAKVVRAWPLKDHLMEDVAKRIRDLHLPMQMTQNPDARINSNPKRWISFLKDGPPVAYAGDGLVAPPPSQSTPVVAAPEPFDVAQVVDSMLVDMLSQRGGTFPGLVASRAPRQVDARSMPLRDIVRRLTKFGRTRHSLKDSWIQVDGLNASPLFQAPDTDGPSARWLWLEKSGYFQVPKVHGFVTTVAGEDDKVEEIELISDSAPVGRSSMRVDARLSALICGAAVKGGFNPDRERITEIYEASKGGEALSFGATLHLAYALHDGDMHKQVAALSELSAEIYGFYPYDLAMLAGQIYEGEVLAKPLLPSYPMMAKGWNLVNGFVALPNARYAVLKRTLLPGLWATFNVEGYESIRQA